MITAVAVKMDTGGRIKKTTQCNVPPPFPGCPLLARLCHPSRQGHPGATQGGEACLQRGVLQGMERGGRAAAEESKREGGSAGAREINWVY